MINLVDLIRWVGVDVSSAALEVARASGIPCAEIDFTSAIGFRDESFDVVMMTEVLEHLPYPSIIVREVHRILKNSRSAYVGSVPLDYHLHRRWKVLRGKRLPENKPCSSFFVQRARPSAPIISRPFITCLERQLPFVPRGLHLSQLVCSGHRVGRLLTQG
jgi:SAM-dependent methyltransferase